MTFSFLEIGVLQDTPKQLVLPNQVKQPAT